VIPGSSIRVGLRNHGDVAGAVQRHFNFAEFISTGLTVFGSMLINQSVSYDYDGPI
jgi:hypothetical protein